MRRPGSALARVRLCLRHRPPRRMMIAAMSEKGRISKARIVISSLAVCAIVGSLVVIVRELIPGQRYVPPPPAPVMAPTPRSPADLAKDDEQDRQLMSVLNSNQRWAQLPKDIGTVYRDA